MPYTLNVNGKSTTVDVPADMPLLWVLLDVLNLRGTKYGCGIGACGACTVHINGRAVRSCQARVSTVTAPITTIEGLSADGTHPVQQAWQEVDVAQCGYCQAGQIMSAVALLQQKPKPSDADIDQAMNGNICRCGTYIRIRQAVHRAATIASTNTTAQGQAQDVAVLTPKSSHPSFRQDGTRRGAAPENIASREAEPIFQFRAAEAEPREE